MTRISPFVLLFCCLTVVSSLAQSIPSLTPGVSQPPTLACGVSDQNLPDSTIRLMGQAHLLLARQNARRATSPRNICRIAVEIDSDTYLAYDKDTSAIIRDVLNNIEAASTIFERDINTQLVVVRIHIWKDTEPDPYRGVSSIFVLMNTFVSSWNKNFKEVGYDKACYLFTKQVSGAGGLGNLDGPYSISLLPYVPTIAHELGHNFNSPHTHSCSWAGGPIDYCAPIEGTNCNYSGSLETAPDGTIMSYCSNRVLAFHPLCRAVMTDHAEKKLSKLTKSPDTAPVLPAQFTPGRSSYLYWPGIAEAEHYQLEVATDAAFRQKIITDSSAVNGYELSLLRTSGSVYVRVRAINQFGASAWSGSCQVSVGANLSLGPIMLSPTHDQRLIPYNNNAPVPFAVQPVAGATAYEWQISNQPNLTYASTFTTTQPTTSLPINQNGVVYWWVRSWKSNVATGWSVARRFFRNPPGFWVSLPFESSAPFSFPYGYYPSSTDVNLIRVQAALSIDPSFERVIWQQQLVFTRGFLGGMLKALQPNTQYYLRVQELRAATNTDYPPGVLTEAVRSFKTGSAVLPAQWQFFNNETVADLPPGRVINLIPTTDAIWLQLEETGIFQLDPAKSTGRAVNRASTKGAIGNQNLYLDPNGADGLWLTNAISINGGKPFSSARQSGRFISGPDSLSQRIVVKPNNAYFNGFSNAPRLYIGFNAIYAQQSDSLSAVYQVGENTSIQRYLLRQSSVWMVQSNWASQRNEVVEFDRLTKKQRAFSKATTPQLGQNLNELVVDGLGNIWVSQTDPSSFTFPRLAKFDGQQWTSYPQSTVPFNFIHSFGADAVGNLYVLGQPNSGQNNRLWRFDGQVWKEIGQLPSLSYSLGNMLIDRQGSIWWYNGNFQVVRFNSCSGITTPKLAATKNSVEVGESTMLKAEGCTSAIWSWSSVAGSTTDLLVKAANELVVTPTANTTYRVRCYDEGCSGSEASLTLTVRPRLSVTKINKTDFCPNDRLTATVSVTGSMEPTNQYVAVFKSATQTIRSAPVSATTEVSVPIASSLVSGRYIFYLESTQPAVRSRDSVQINVAALPTAELATTRTALVSGDSTQVVVTLTGTSPWRFTRWDGQLVQATISPYTSWVKATSQASYSVSISSLSDANCAAGTLKNTLVLSLITGTEPQFGNVFIVKPNPTTGIVTIEALVNETIASIQVYDQTGSAIQRLTFLKPTRKQVIDLSTSAAGIYLLKAQTTNGHLLTWKIIKL